MKHKIPFLYFLIAIIPPLTGAGNFLVAKATNGDIGPMALLFWRWAVAWLFLFPFVIKDAVKEWKKIQGHYKIVLLTALPGVVLFNAVMYTALNYTTSINASIIANTFPIFIVILSYFILKESINFIKLLAIILAFAGTIFIMTNGNLHQLRGLFDNRGDLMALFGALMFAGYAISLRFRPKDLKVATFTFATFTVGCLLIFPMYLWEVLYVKQPIYSNQVIGAILFVAIPVSVFGVICWNFTITHLGATTAGLIFYLAPVFNIVLSKYFLDEPFTLSHFAGLCLILLGVNLPLIASFSKKSYPNKT